MAIKLKTLNCQQKYINIMAGDIIIHMIRKLVRYQTISALLKLVMFLTLLAIVQAIATALWQFIFLIITNICVSLPKMKVKELKYSHSRAVLLVMHMNISKTQHSIVLLISECLKLLLMLIQAQLHQTLLKFT